jgi:hypothetical protein
MVMGARLTSPRLAGQVPFAIAPWVITAVFSRLKDTVGELPIFMENAGVTNGLKPYLRT